MHEVIADNVYHRAVAVGPVYDVTSVQGGRRPWMTINGVRQEATAPLPSLGGTVAIMAEFLGAVGERLRAGDRMICGSLTHCPVEMGDHVVAGVDGLGGVPPGMV
jgi:2-keto-4-pentenoate hydratase